MKRWMFATILAVGMLMPALSFAAEGKEAAGKGTPEATSPLYAPNEGLITGVAAIAIFALLLAILGTKAWGPILNGLKSREDKIRKDIADAEAARAKAEALLKDYNQQLADAASRAQAVLDKARADAEALAAQIRARGQQEAEESRERATREIEDAKNQALREIHEHAATLATSAAEKIIRKSLNPGDYRDLVDQSIGELQGMRA